MLALRSRWLVALTLMVMLGATAVLAIDAPTRAPAAVAQQIFLPDNFSGKDAWWPDEATGADTFPLTRAYDTTAATLEAGESAPCAAIGRTVWFSWYGDRPGTLNIDTTGSDFATVLAVYTFDFDGNITPSPPGAQLAPVACARSEGNERARLSVEVVPGREYLIQSGGLDGASGELRLNATCACPPPNDQYGAPSYLYLDSYQPAAVRTIDTTRAGIEAGEPTACGNTAGTVWYRLYVSATQQLVVLDPTASAVPAAVAVYEWTPTSDTFSFAQLRRIGCGAGAPLALSLNNSQEYWVQLGGIDGAAGLLTLETRCDPACPPYNDSIGTYEYWEPPATTFNRVNTAGATLEAGEPQPCGGIGKTVWYQVTARGDTTLTVETALAGFASAVAAYEIVGLSPPPAQWDVLGCDAADSASGSARLAFPVRANQPYYVQVGGVNGAGGMLDVTFDCDPEPCPPHNDSVHYPEFVPALLPFEVETSGNTRGATTEAGEPADCGNMGRSVWYSLEVYETWSPVPLLYSTDGSTFDTAIAVYELPLYEPADFSATQRVACDAGGEGRRGRVAWTAMPGKRYLVQVGGRGGASGDLVLHAACNPFCPPENDNLAGSWYLGPGYVQSVDVRGATIEAGEPSPQCGAMDHTVWYRIEPSVAGASTWRIDTTGSMFEPHIAVYTIEGISPPGGGLSSVWAGCTGSLTFETTGDRAYYIQVGAAPGTTGGQLELRAECAGQCGSDSVVGPDNPDTGGGASGSSVQPPDTGSGGYLPGASP